MIIILLERIIMILDPNNKITREITLTEEAWSCLALAARRAVDETTDGKSREFSQEAWAAVEEIATNVAGS
jgi:hypothetical protein